MKYKKELTDSANGFTLVELLVAMALGIVLSGTIVNVYLENKRSFMQDEEVARLQENGRFALNMLKREITMAGFFAQIADASKLTTGTVTGDCTSGNWALSPIDSVDLINNVSTALNTLQGEAWTCLTVADLQAGTDLISVKRSADRATLVDGSLNTGITAENDDQWYLRTADDNTSVGWSYVAASGSIPTADKTAGSGVNYWEFYSSIFFIREYSISAGDGVPSLCVRNLVGSSMTSAASLNCMVEGIENMQLEIGIDADADGVPERFEASPSSAEMEDAVAVRVYLLVRSIEGLPGYTNNKAYQLGSTAVAATNDNFMRRVFSTTLSLRNARLPGV